MPGLAWPARGADAAPQKGEWKPGPESLTRHAHATSASERSAGMFHGQGWDAASCLSKTLFDGSKRLLRKKRAFDDRVVMVTK